MGQGFWHGVTQGYTIYLPMVMELPVAMLGCARIGAIHSIVFGGFSAEALRDRIQDCEAETRIRGPGSIRARCMLANGSGMNETALSSMLPDKR